MFDRYNQNGTSSYVEDSLKDKGMSPREKKMKEIPRIERFTIRPRFSEIFSQIKNEIEQNSQFKS